jgi:hypothetical protein
MVQNTRVKRALSRKQVGVTPVSNLTPGIHTSLTPVLTRQNSTRVGLKANTRTQSIPQPSAYNSQVKHHIPGLPSAAPLKTNLTFPINQSNSFDKKQKLQQSQAMTLFRNVGICIDHERYGNFDDWMTHLESVLVLGDFEESRESGFITLETVW